MLPDPVKQKVLSHVEGIIQKGEERGSGSIPSGEMVMSRYTVLTIGSREYQITTKVKVRDL